MAKRIKSKLSQDRNGVWFLMGCRVKNIYSDKYGEVVDRIERGGIVRQFVVLYDDEEYTEKDSPICLEVVGGGLVFNK